MRVLLINSNRFKHPWPVIPFGLACVATAIETAGHQVQALDLCFSKNCDHDIENKISQFRPEVIGISVRNIDNSAGYNTLFLLDQVKDEVVNPCKRLFTGPMVIGGPSVGVNGPEMLSYFDLEFAIRGDGEIAMVDFLARLQTKSSLSGLGGLIWRKDSKIVENNPATRVANLDTLPLTRPQRYIDLKPYRLFDSPIQIQTKRGCALNCSYCTYKEIEGSSYRLKNPKRVADDIETLVQETGINHIEFTDSTFNYPLQHTKSVLREVAKKNLNLKIRTMGLNPGAVDEELAELMQHVGFRDIDLGAEAGCDEILSNLGKNFSKADLLQAAKILQSKGLPIVWYLLVGAPGETEQTLRETFDTINLAASKWDLVNIGVGLRIYNGAPIAQMKLNEDPYCTADNFLQPLHYTPSALSLEDVKRITKKEAFRHTNYFMYDEDENLPVLAMIMGVALLKLLAPKQPLWRLHIVIRTVQKALGITLIKRIWFEFRIRRFLTKK